MIMSPRLRKLALTAHLTFSIGWLGTVSAFLAIAIAGIASEDATLVRAAYLAMRLLVSYVILPAAFVSLLTGLVSALGTKWGLFRHYWVVIKFLLTGVTILVLFVQLKPIGDLADLAADPNSSIAVLRSPARRPLVHAAGGIAVLLLIQVIGVYKPWGATPFGRREQRAESHSGARAARWPYLLGITIVVALLVLLAIHHLTRVASPDMHDEPIGPRGAASKRSR